MPIPTPTESVVGYVLGCRVMRDGPPPPVNVCTMNDERGWQSAVTWSQQYGVTVAFAGPFESRREAVLAMREHLRERRVMARRDAAALIERRARRHASDGSMPRA